MRVFLAVAAALALLPAAAYGQAADTRNRALIVLDSSKSMNDPAGEGGTRLDAAKQAVDTLVDKLPSGAPIGLRVYGSKVSEATRAEACRDTELVIPVGPLDKEELRGAVNGLQARGRTPIGNSLLATPDDLGSGEGRRSVILVSDGGDNCAPPDPCDAAAEVSRQGVDLTISVVGLQVNERVRRQLQCIARAGGGSYSDVQDAGQLGDELAALLARAYRSYEPSGTGVQGAGEPGDGPALGPGLFQDEVGSNEQRWYEIEVPEGRRVLASVTAIPPSQSLGDDTFRTELLDPAGDEVAVDQGLLTGGLNASEAGRVLTHSLRTEGAVEGGRYRLGVSLEGEDFDSVPIELAIQLLAPGEEVGLTRQAGELATPTPTPTPSAPPAATAPLDGDDDAQGGAPAWLVIAAAAIGGLLIGLLLAVALARRPAT